MGASELIQGLGRALAVLREAGHPQSALQALEDDITSLDAVLFRDAAEAEQRAAHLVARLYGIAHPPAAAPDPPQVSAGSSAAATDGATADVPAPDTHMAAPAEAGESDEEKRARLQAELDALG